MKRLSIALDDTTWELVLQKAVSEMAHDSLTGKGITKKAGMLIIQKIMEAFPSDVLPCETCGKIFSIEADEGSLREEGAFCNKHLPKDRG